MYIECTNHFLSIQLWSVQYQYIHHVLTVHFCLVKHSKCMVTDGSVQKNWASTSPGPTPQFICLGSNSSELS